MVDHLKDWNITNCRGNRESNHKCKSSLQNQTNGGILDVFVAD